MNYYRQTHERLQRLLVKEDKVKQVPAERVSIVSLRMVKESSLLYKDSCIRSPEDGYNLLKQFLGDVDPDISSLSV